MSTTKSNENILMQKDKHLTAARTRLEQFKITLTTAQVKAKATIAAVQEENKLYEAEKAELEKQLAAIKSKWYDAQDKIHIATMTLKEIETITKHDYHPDAPELLNYDHCRVNYSESYMKASKDLFQAENFEVMAQMVSAMNSMMAIEAVANMQKMITAYKATAAEQLAILNAAELADFEQLSMRARKLDDYVTEKKKAHLPYDQHQELNKVIVELAALKEQLNVFGKVLTTIKSGNLTRQQAVQHKLKYWRDEARLDEIYAEFKKIETSIVNLETERYAAYTHHNTYKTNTYLLLVKYEDYVNNVLNGVNPRGRSQDVFPVVWDDWIRKFYSKFLAFCNEYHPAAAKMETCPQCGEFLQCTYYYLGRNANRINTHFDSKNHFTVTRESYGPGFSDEEVRHYSCHKLAK